MTPAEEMSVKRLVHRYAHALDDGDVDAILACFAADAHVLFEGGAIVLEGRAALRAFLRERQVGSAMHVFGTLLAERQGDHVAVRASALISTLGSAGTVAMRGVKYAFKLRGAGEEWSITHLSHRPQWAIDAPKMLLGRIAEPIQS